MRAGGTANGLCELAEEVGAEVVGVYLFIAAKEPAKKLVREYASLLTLRGVDETSKAVDIVPERCYKNPSPLSHSRFSFKEENQT